MKPINHNPILFELQSWARSLMFMDKENAIMKIHLALITKNITENKLLEKIELIQYDFIAQDNILSIMRSDVAKQIKDAESSSNYGTEYIKHHLNFRKGMVLIETQFNKAKEGLHSFSENQF